MQYEVGPIRPPSEAQSMLIRVTRGCHWNKCKFCGLYKACEFSVRPLSDILEDINKASIMYKNKKVTSCFLQDSDAFVLSTEKLLPIVDAIKTKFPDIQYITSYARSDSILRKKSSEIKKLYDAGLNHLYCGMESGSNKVLKLINKGINAEQVIESGVLIKESGMLLSEFILQGIGGRELSEENAVSTARALNVIKPDFIRVHATAIKPDTPMNELLRKGQFSLQSEEEIVLEQKRMLEELEEINSYYINEHIVNLLLEVRGYLDTDKKKMINKINEFLNLTFQEKENFAVGRRLNIYFTLSDLKVDMKKEKVSTYVTELKKTGVNIPELCNYMRSKVI